MLNEQLLVGLEDARKTEARNSKSSEYLNELANAE
jgi:hypothetical protein